MQADEVRFRQQRVHILKRGVHRLLRVLRCAHRIRINHLHVEAQRPPRHRPANPPKPHNPQRLPPNVRAAKLVQVPAFPVSGARQLFAFAKPPRHRHQQRPRKIRRRLVQHAGCIRGHHAALGASRHVNVVETHRDVCGDAQLRRRAQQSLIYLFRQQANQSFFVPHAPQHLFPGRTLCWRPVFHVACGIQYFARFLKQFVRTINLRLRHPSLLIF